jgi:6,7-dimethyl-8-ribityllumazine synthase
VAVLAGPDARADDVTRATSTTAGPVEVRRVGGALEAQAAAAALAAEDYDTVIGAGAQARAAVAQAEAGELGDGTRWRSTR